MIRHLLQEITVELDGPRRVVEVLLVELGDAVLVADPLGRILRQLGLVLEDAEQLLPVLRRLVEDVEATERLEIVGIDLEHALVGVDRPRHVAELALVDRADLVVDELLLLGVGDEIRLLRVHREEVRPPREPEVELDQRVDGAEILRVELEDLAVDGDGLIVPLEDLFFDGSGLVEGRLLVVGLVEDVRLLLEDLRQLLVALGAAEDAIERLRRREVLGVDLQHLAVVAHGAVEVGEVVLVDARAHGEERARELGLGLASRQRF